MRPGSRSARGAATLGITLMLLAASTLLSLFAARELLLAQRSAANLARSAQAFEAAEAGLEWALAQLNGNSRVTEDCRPGPAPPGNSFRSRYLTVEPQTGLIAAAPRREASCSRDEEGWSCHCGPGPTTEQPLSGPAFVVRFESTPHPGVVRVHATGCTSASGDCVTGSIQPADAEARHQTAFGLVSALPAPPLAAVTVRGDFEAAPATGLRNTAPRAGIAVRAGGRIQASHARLEGPAGAPSSSLLLSNDRGLAATSPEQFFASHFGVDPLGWKALPSTVRLRCEQDCGDALQEKIAAADEPLAIHVEGDLTVQGPVTLGSPGQPVILVVTGTIQLQGAVGVHGVLYGHSLHWEGAQPGAFVRGALLCATHFSSHGAPDLAYDAEVLARLRGGSGGFARVNGAWKDF